ncbi:MAG: hypothetical protein ACW99G_24265 [Candidatus Thorarchaeota archaeon]|jgi:hypothetical protein
MSTVIDEILALIIKTKEKTKNEDKFMDAMVLFYEGVLQIFDMEIEA